LISTLFVMFFQAIAGDPAVATPAETPAPVAQAAPEAAPPAAETKKRKTKSAQSDQICRNDYVVGSRMPVRVCRSRESAEDDTSASRAWLDRAQSQMPAYSN